MRLYQTTLLKHICIGNVTVSGLTESSKTLSAVGSRCLLGLKLSCTGASGPCYLTYRKHFIRAFSSKYTYEDAFGLPRDKKFWSEAAKVQLFICFLSRFVGRKLNVCYNAVDRHVEDGRGDRAAVIYDSPVTGTKFNLFQNVSRFAGVLVRHGVKMGDLVVIYVPMVPQAMFSMLACAHIGATHSLIFGGFASKELSVRIDHAKPKLLVTASFGIEPGRRVEYIPLVEKALELSSHKPHKVLIYNRPSMEKVSMHPDLSLDWEEEMATARPHDCVSVPAHHPLYVLYTSGTTGTPKVWWAASDLGWVVGHSYICYGPLLHGSTLALPEGKPVGTPDPGAFFCVMSEHGMASMFTAPTAIRAIRQQDPQAEHGKQYPLSRLRNLFVAGERCDIETLEWAKRSFGVPVLDHWWQTESGSSITASCVGLGCSRTPPAGTAGQAVPGYNKVRFLYIVIDDDMQQVKPRTLGNIVVKLPLPPGAALSLWQNQTLFKELYFTKFPGYYDTMDAGFVNEEGFLYIMSRSDDVINVAGHRLSTGALEESVLLHPAVVGLEDPLKGHVPLALCVLRNDCQETEDVLANEMVKLVRDTIGPVAAFKKVVFVKALPKTHSGKIPRSTLANLVNHKPYKISPTIEDPEVFKDIEKVLRETVKEPGK
uniref:Acyl-CoA synthetase short-chain family member 3, mitochondrial n=1 Tax=Cyprinus carpio TaxID=7962 RepID=A0A8C1LVB1_CYPCA